MYRTSPCEAAAHARRFHCFWRGECGPHRDSRWPHRLSSVRPFMRMTLTNDLTPWSDGGIGVRPPSWDLHHMSRETGSPLKWVFFISIYLSVSHSLNILLYSPKTLYLPLPLHPQPHAAKEFALFPIQYDGALLATASHETNPNCPRALLGSAAIRHHTTRPSLNLTLGVKWTKVTMSRIRCAFNCSFMTCDISVDNGLADGLDG